MEKTGAIRRLSVALQRSLDVFYRMISGMGVNEILGFLFYFLFQEENLWKQYKG